MVYLIGDSALPPSATGAAVTEVKATRRDLVRWAVDKDGGAHVDARLAPEYEVIRDGAGWSMTVSPDGGPSRVVPFLYAHLSALQQMGYELLHSSDIQHLRAT